MSEMKEKFIFISYAHKDSEAVYPIIEALKKKNFNVWYDNGIEAGSEWPEYIAGKIIESTVVLVLLSKNALESHNCRREINYAIRLQKEMLVAYLEDMQLPPGMEMQLTILQDIKKDNFADSDAFCSALADAKILQQCRAEEKAETVKESVFHEFTKEPDIFADFGTDPYFAKATKKEEPVPAPAKEKPVSAPFSIENVVVEYNWNSKNKLLRPDEMKSSRIKNVLKYVAADSGETENDIVAFRDLTVLDSGKEGFLMTKTALYYRYLGSSCTVKYSDIAGVEETKSCTNFCLNNGSILGIENTNLFDLYLLIETLLKQKGIFNPDFDSLVERGNGIRRKIARANKVATEKYYDSNNGFVFAEMISEKCKNNAAKYVADNRISPEEIIAFRDLTIMGSGKEGIVITDEGIYYRYVGESFYIGFDDVISVHEDQSAHEIVVRLSNDRINIESKSKPSRAVYELLKNFASKTIV